MVKLFLILVVAPMVLIVVSAAGPFILGRILNNCAEEGGR